MIGDVYLSHEVALTMVAAKFLVLSAVEADWGQRETSTGAPGFAHRAFLGMVSGIFGIWCGDFMRLAVAHVGHCLYVP